MRDYLSVGREAFGKIVSYYGFPDDEGRLMMSLYEPLLTELQQESATTRRLLERLPESALSWKPHEKSMSMGHLAVHIARLLQLLNSVLNQEDYDIAASGLE